MTVRTTLLENHPTGVPAEEWRLITARFLPSPTNGLTPSGGVLPAPAGYLGEVTLLSPEALRVNPAVWVIPGTQSGVQGAYVVPNDAAVERAIGPRDASLTRLDRLVVQVQDTAYLPNEGVDSPDVRLIPGTPALSGATLPALPPNALHLGQVTVPPGTGTVTFTPAVLARQVAVGGVQPIPSGLPEFDGSYDGQLRDHPVRGLQRWDVATATWGPLRVERLRIHAVDDAQPRNGGPRSLLHGLQIGPEGGPTLIADTNEIIARDADGYAIPWYPRAIEVDPPVTNGQPPRLIDTWGPVLRLVRSTAGGLTHNAWVPISWDAQAHDYYDMWGSGANVTVRKDGYYWIAAGYAVAASAAGRRAVRVLRNGTATGIGRGTGGFTAAPDAGVECSGLALLAAGDVIVVQTFQDSGASQSVSTADFAQCILHMTYVRGPNTAAELAA